MRSDFDDIDFESISVLDGANTDVRQSVWSLMQLADTEFIPPLSSRQSPKDTALDHGCAKGQTQPVEYFREMSKQPIILARLNDKVIGFMSYKTNYDVPEISKKVHAYVSTIIVDPTVRGRKVTTRLYQHLLDILCTPVQEAPVLVATRTWSTNLNHLTILERLGFQCVFRKKDGRGEGIDTVVYMLTGSLCSLN